MEIYIWVPAAILANPHLLEYKEAEPKVCHRLGRTPIQHADAMLASHCLPLYDEQEWACRCKSNTATGIRRFSKTQEHEVFELRHAPCFSCAKTGLSPFTSGLEHYGHDQAPCAGFPTTRSPCVGWGPCKMIRHDCFYIFGDVKGGPESRKIPCRNLRAAGLGSHDDFSWEQLLVRSRLRQPVIRFIPLAFLQCRSLTMLFRV